MQFIFFVIFQTYVINFRNPNVHWTTGINKIIKYPAYRFRMSNHYKGTFSITEESFFSSDKEAEIELVSSMVMLSNL